MISKYHSGYVALETARFEESPHNRTCVTAQSVFMNVQDRDGMIHSGMEAGVNESFERLDKLLLSMFINDGCASNLD